MSRPEIDFKSLRKEFIRAELLRFRIASYAVIAIAAITLVFVAVMSLKSEQDPGWRLVTLFGLSVFCIALPLFSNISVSKDGGSFEIVNPLDLINELEEKASAARSEGYDETRKQISAVSMQMSELYELITHYSGPKPDKSLQSFKDISFTPTDEEPTLREIRKSLPSPTNVNDPQKGRFGGSETSTTRRLCAKVKPSALGKPWRRLFLSIESTDGKPLTGKYAYFFLHDTFQPNIYRVKVAPDEKSADFEIAAFGAFTAGVVADRGETKLEIDLATSTSFDAPTSWREK